MPGSASFRTLYSLMYERVPSGPVPQARRRGGVEPDAAILRMLARLGLVRSARPVETNLRRAEALIQELGAEVDAPPDRVAEAFAAYAHPTDPGGVVVCGEKPKCEQCNLRQHCAHHNRRPSIKDLPEDERPRERLIRHGPEALSDAELLAIIIRDGTPKESAVTLAKHLRARFGSLEAISRLGIAELREIDGIGPAKAAQVKAAMELAKRLGGRVWKLGEKFKGSEQVFKHFDARMRDLKQEKFICMLLDTKNRLIKEVEVSRGGLSGSTVDVKTVFSHALRENASAVIFVHNHPTGDVTPSREDLAVTQRLKEAGELMGIRMLDHVIVGGGSYRSLVPAVPSEPRM